MCRFRGRITGSRCDGVVAAYVLDRYPLSSGRKARRDLSDCAGEVVEMGNHGIGREFRYMPVGIAEINSDDRNAG